MTSEPTPPASLPTASVEPPPLPALPAAPPLPGPATGEPGGPFPFAAAIVDAALALGAILMLSVLLVMAVILPSLLADGGAGAPDRMQENMQALLPEMTIAAISAMLLSAILVWFVRRGSLRGTLPRMPTGTAYGLALAAGVAIQALSLALGWFLHQFDTGLQPSNAAPLIALVQDKPWMAWALVVIAGPFAEELLFRHVLLRRFALAGRGVAGLFVTSLMFALLHEPVPGAQSVLAWLGSLAIYVGMGVGFGAVYLRTGRLGAAFAAHATCNLLALAAMAYSSS